MSGVQPLRLKGLNIESALLGAGDPLKLLEALPELALEQQACQ